MGCFLQSFYNSTHPSSQMMIRRLTISYSSISIRRYNQRTKGNNGGQGTKVEERAPSTAEEFRKMAEEKSRQGFASQTVEKARDGIEDATIGNSTSESVKESYKEDSASGGSNFHKNGD